MYTINIANEGGAVDEAVAVLRGGGVVMHPTETCYGLAADVFSKRALDELYRLKGMPLDKPVSILVDSLAMAEEYGIFSDKAIELAQEYWPGPLSILVPRKRALPTYFNPNSDFVSIRFSAMEFCTQMVDALGHPVTTTSANKFSEPELYFPEPIEGIDLLIDAGEINKNKPSTIVKVDGDLLEIIRQGGVFINI